MTFAEYILEQNRKNEEYEVLIDNTEMPATYVGNDEETLSAYAYEKYGEILNAECEIVNVDQYGCETVEVYSDNYEMGKQFTCAFAGYCASKEYDMLFPSVAGRIHYAGSGEILEFTDKEDFSKELEDALYNGIAIKKVDDYTEERVWNNIYHAYFDDEEIQDNAEKNQEAQSDDRTNDYKQSDPYCDYHLLDSNEIMLHCLRLGENDHIDRKNSFYTNGLFLLPKKIPVHNDNETAFSAIESVEIRGKGNMSIDEMYEYFENKKGVGGFNYDDIHEIENITLNMTDRKGVSYKKTVDKEQFFLAVENFHDNYRDFYNAYQKHEANKGK
jgi:hypothetical protein